MATVLSILIVAGISSLLVVQCKHLSFQENFKIAKNFKCVPRPRSICVSKLVENQDLAAHNAMPRHVILHRCDDFTGCCRNMKKVCQVKSVELVEMDFYFHTERRTLTMTNHTSCGCTFKNNKIK